MFYVLGSSRYGAIGTTFSLVYLLISLSSFGFEASFAPFLTSLTKSSNLFIRYLSIYVLLQIPLLLIFALSGYYISFYFFGLPSFSLSLPIFSALILSEGLRIFFRRLLHNIFLSKPTIILEQIFSFAYLAFIWLSFFLGYPLSLHLLFIPYLITSISVLLIFLFFTYSFTTSLPSTSFPPPPHLFNRILKSRSFNSLTNFSTLLVSGNLLVPFFASTFGPHHAGIFKLVSIFANSAKALIKSTVYFSGGAYLAALKSSPLKLTAFKDLSQKLLPPILVTLSLTFLFSSILPLPTPLLTLTFLFLFITLLRHFSLIYDQLFIIEEASKRLLFIKLIELILTYTLILSNKKLTPNSSIYLLTAIQIISFLILATDAYSKWKILPTINKKNITTNIITITAISIAITIYIIKFLLIKK